MPTPTYDIPTVATLIASVYRRANLGTVVAGHNNYIETLAQINQILREIYNAGDWYWKRTTTTLVTVLNQDYVALPVDFQSFYLPELYTTDKTRVLVICRDPVYFDRVKNAATTTGVPTLAMPEWGNTSDPPFLVLRFAPTPDAAYTFTFPYKRKATVLTLTTERPNIPEHWLPAYENKLLYRVLLTTRGRETAERFWRENRESWNDARDTEDEMADVNGLSVPESNTRVLDDLPSSMFD